MLLGWSYQGERNGRNVAHMETEEVNNLQEHEF
jgi:hypothetical protein